MQDRNGMADYAMNHYGLFTIFSFPITLLRNECKHEKKNKKIIHNNLS